VADGEFKAHFQNIVQAHQLEGRVAICDFDETLARQVYGAADFVLMPSRYEPCGLPQMIGSRYGVLPVAHKTGGLMDTIVNLNAPGNRGNGFLFETFDAGGLRWAIEQAMGFYRLPLEIKSAQIQRVMEESKRAFDHTAMVNRYQEIYEELLQRPLN
jgi:starch synthase